MCYVYADKWTNSRFWAIYNTWAWWAKYSLCAVKAILRLFLCLFFTEEQKSGRSGIISQTPSQRVVSFFCLNCNIDSWREEENWKGSGSHWNIQDSQTPTPQRLYKQQTFAIRYQQFYGTVASTFTGWGAQLTQLLWNIMSGWTIWWWITYNYLCLPLVNQLVERNHFFGLLLFLYFPNRCLFLFPQGEKYHIIQVMPKQTDRAILCPVLWVKRHLMEANLSKTGMQEWRESP